MQDLAAPAQRRKASPRLCRLVRFEKSPLLSKAAAVAIARAARSTAEPPGDGLIEAVRKCLDAVQAARRRVAVGLDAVGGQPDDRRRWPRGPN